MSQKTLPDGDSPIARDHPRPSTSIREYSLAFRALAEAVGAFLLVLAGVGVTILNTQTGVQPTLAFGLALIGAMVAFGYVSGGHFNPAVTLGSAVAGRTSWTSVLPYVVAQVVGALAAAGLIWLLLSANEQFADSVQALFSVSANGFAENSPTQFALSSAFLAEVVAAAIFTAVFLGATARSADGAFRGAGAPFAVGLVYAVLLTFLLPITNGSLNPARSTASAVFSEGWALEQLWLFWAAPVLGTVIAGLVYRSTDLFGGSRDGDDTDPATGADHTDAVHSATTPATTASDAAVPTAAGDHYPADHARSGRDETGARPDRPAGTDDARDFFDGEDNRRDPK